MSDYVHKKVIRYPLRGLMDKLNISDGYDCENYLKEKLGNLYNRNKGFELELTDKNWYLDFVYYYTYGESSGNFGNVRIATDAEYGLLYSYLEEVFKDTVPKYKLRAVEYSYYNCCECEDYYELPENSDDSLIIKQYLDETNKD